MFYWYPDYADPFSWFTSLFRSADPPYFNLSYYEDPALDRAVDGAAGAHRHRPRRGGREVPGAPAPARRRGRRAGALRAEVAARLPRGVLGLRRQPRVLERRLRLRAGAGRLTCGGTCSGGWRRRPSSSPGSSCSPSRWRGSSPATPRPPYAGPRAGPAELERVRQEFGLDRPAPVQLGDYASGIVDGRLGHGAAHAPPGARRPRARGAADARAGALRDAPGAARRRAARPARGTARRGRRRPRAAVRDGRPCRCPSFLLALILQWLFFQRLGVLPVAGEYDPELDYTDPLTVYTRMTVVDAAIGGNWPSSGSALEHLVLPCLAVAAYPLGAIAMMTRASVLEELGEDHVRMARALGFSERSVVGAARAAARAQPGRLARSRSCSPTRSSTRSSSRRSSTGRGVGSYAVDSIKALDVPAIIGVTLLVALALRARQPARRPRPGLARPADRAAMSAVPTELTAVRLPTPGGGPRAAARAARQAPARQPADGGRARARRARSCSPGCSRPCSRRIRRTRARRRIPPRRCSARAPTTCSAPTRSGGTCSRGCSTARGPRCGSRRSCSCSRRPSACRWASSPGYVGGWVDDVIMRITDVFLAFPALLLSLALAAVLSPSVGNATLAIAATWWPWYARLARGAAIQVARPRLRRVRAGARGRRARASSCATCCRTRTTPVLVQMSLDVGGIILTAAALSFLGLGAQDPTPEWGLMVSQGQGFLNTQWWLPVFPGAAILLTARGVQPARRRAAPGARPAAGDAVIAVRDLEIAFGEQVVARVPELDLPRGAIVGLAGESGSGKSMTALAILGLASHAGARVRGSIRLDGEELAGRPERELRRIRGRRIAMVMQSPRGALNPTLRLGTLFDRTLRTHGVASTERAARIRAAIAEVRLGERRAAPVPARGVGGPGAAFRHRAGRRAARGRAPRRRADERARRDRAGRGRRAAAAGARRARHRHPLHLARPGRARPGGRSARRHARRRGRRVGPGPDGARRPHGRVHAASWSPRCR